MDVLSVLALLGFMAGGFWLLWPRSDARDFSADRLRGRTADEVIAELGPPAVDSRGGSRQERDRFWLGYATGEARHRIEFADGKVVEVSSTAERPVVAE